MLVVECAAREKSVERSRLAGLAIGGGLFWCMACTGPSTTQRPTLVPSPVPTAVPTQSAQALPTGVPTGTRLESVRVANTQGLAGGLQVAVARGYFEEQGIAPRPEEFGSTTEIVAPLATGQLDVGSTTPNAQLFNALARGIRITMALSGSQVEAQGNGFPMVARNGPDGPVVHDLTDLRKKRVGQNQQGVINEWALDRLLASVGLQAQDVETKVMPFPDAVAALGAGSLDVAIFPEPFGTIAEQRGFATRVLNADQYIPGGQVAVMSYSDQFAHERPEAARRWAVAYLKGARDYMDAMEYGRDREAIVAILAEAAHISPQVIEQSGYFPVPRDGRVNAEGMQAMLDWLVERGYVTQKPDLTALLDPQFADYAAQTLDAAR